MSREEAQRQEEAGHMVSRAMDQASGIRQSLIAKVGNDNDRGVVGCPCLTVLKPAFFKPEIASSGGRLAPLSSVS